MPTADFRVKVTFDYTAAWDEEDQEVDADVLHDAFMSALDSIDVNFDTEHVMYDDAGDEKEETFTVSLACDSVWEVDVTKLDT